MEIYDLDGDKGGFILCSREVVLFPNPNTRPCAQNGYGLNNHREESGWQVI